MENVEKWKFVYQRRLMLERELGKNAFECKEVMGMIQEAGLMKSVTGFDKCYEMLVKEFIVNISKDCDNKMGKKFRKVYARGRCVNFSPEIINRFLGKNEEEQAEVEVSDNIICIEITVKQIKEWPRKGKLSAVCLSVKYAILQRIGAANWVPTNHTSNITTGLSKFIYIVGTKTNFDFGSYFFEQTMKHVTSFVVKMPIAFPSLIYDVILSKHPSILLSSDSVCQRNSPLLLHYRLFIGKHVPDSVITSGEKPIRFTTKTRILVELKETCKTLDDTIKLCIERKSMLEILIKALSEEGDEGNVEGDNVDGEDSKE
ncbi:uncharacterized protein LOC127121622 [Lathyrus oleraceus]|uniref:uncharacterized protein LOC127121622 n=1 Tax=Pisum sativum TaxID=3888 RepID=UPI0021D2F204|nr:uncharacterized protein LOC127121622 [Pisum sativum]